MGINIPAIETHYGNCRFRSRTEARWAVFFDALGVRWEYEKEGFELGVLGRYLPDFWLPDLDCWIEIKGEQPTDKEHQKCEALCMGTQKDVFLFIGVPKTNDEYHLSEGDLIYRFVDELNLDDDIRRRYIGVDNWQRFVACEKCKKVGITFSGWRHYLCSCSDRKCEFEDDSRIDDACMKATSARFEFNEAQTVRPAPQCVHVLQVLGILLASNGQLQVCAFCAVCRVKLSDAFPHVGLNLADMDVFKSNLLAHEDDIPYAKEYVAKKLADRKQQAEEKP